MRGKSFSTYLQLAPAVSQRFVQSTFILSKAYLYHVFVKYKWGKTRMKIFFKRDQIRCVYIVTYWKCDVQFIYTFLSRNSLSLLVVAAGMSMHEHFSCSNPLLQLECKSCERKCQVCRQCKRSAKPAACLLVQTLIHGMTATQKATWAGTKQTNEKNAKCF